MSKRPDRVCVIMAGGSGERFWPMSRRLRPKQLLRLTDPDRNMLEDTVRRVGRLVPPDDVYIATSQHLQEPIRGGESGVPHPNVIAEPCKRNTAGCLAWVAAVMLAKYGEEARQISMAALSADHRVPEYNKFAHTVERAFNAVETEPLLAVLGIRPTRPETGYGYIELGESTGEKGVYYVSSFREKPDRATAEDFVRSGQFLWNSGNFFWGIGTFLDELAKASPKHAKSAQDMADALAKGNEEEAERIFRALDDISIDFALMEKTHRVAVIEADFEWDDVGAWDALDRSYPHDENGNVTSGKPVLVDVKNSIVYNDLGPERMSVGVVGVENLAVIVTEDGVLVMPRDRAQDVKQVVGRLKEEDSSHI